MAGSNRSLALGLSLIVGSLVVLLIIGVAFTPVITCDTSTLDNPKSPPQNTKHVVTSKHQEKYYSWICRVCEGDYRGTRLRKWFLREGATPPEDAKEITEARYRVIRFMAGLKYE